MRKFWILIYLSFLLLASFLRKGEISPSLNTAYGFSFSPRYAQSLGLDPRESFEAALSLGPKIVRLPVYWDNPDYEFLDWALEKSAEQSVQTILSIGYRNFRYPECYAPEDTKNLSLGDFKGVLFDHLREVVGHFDSYENLFAWQVENEPFDLPLFRRWCRHVSSEFISAELEHVKSLDPHHPVVLNFGGEVLFRPLWSRQTRLADIIGVSFYPETRTPLGNFPVRTYEIPFSPRNIAAEEKYFAELGKNFWVTEFQAEPWGDNPFTVSDFQRNLEILEKQGGAKVVLFWGVEYWYKERLEGKDELWEFGLAILQNP